MIFQKFTRDREGQARSIAYVIGFRKNLSREDREYLDRYTRWPYERVWDGPYATGFLVPEIPEEFVVSSSSRRRDLDVPRTLDVLRAADTPAETAERVALLAGLCRTVGFLHEHGWVFGDLSVRSMALALGPPRMLLLGCEGAASLANRDRVQAHAPGWAPPESQPLQDAATDVYKLGLVIVRALAPGASSASARDPERLRGKLDPVGVALVARALSLARRVRPTAGELAAYLELAANPTPASRPRQPAEAPAPLPAGSPTVISRSPELDVQSPAQPAPVEPGPSGPAAAEAESESPLEPVVPGPLGHGPSMSAASLAVPPVQPDPLWPDDPTSVGKYRLLGRLGAGGMGTVYLGVSPGGRWVAVKVLQAAHADDPEFRKRFAREVAAAQLVNGFYTAQVLDADPDATPPWLATALVPGPTLAVAVRSDGPMPEDDVRRLGAALVEGLAEIHRCRLVHRDLKPGNIILAADGPRIIDFGIARNLDATSALTRTDTVIGTFAYMSPEQAGGEPIGPPSDVFALGAVLTFAGRGRGPFDAPYPAVLTRILTQPPDLYGLPAELAGVIAACLEKDPARRPDLGDLMHRLNGPPERAREAYSRER